MPLLVRVTFVDYLIKRSSDISSQKQMKLGTCVELNEIHMKMLLPQQRCQFQAPLKNFQNTLVIMRWVKRFKFLQEQFILDMSMFTKSYRKC